jgi:hypothetical protein
MIKNLLLLFGLLLAFVSSAQENFRLETEVTIKEVNTSKNQNILWKGHIYFNKPDSKLLYDFSFPKPIKWLFTEESVYDIRRDTIKNVTDNITGLESTLFYLGLENQLPKYGFDNTIYELSETKREEDLVISVWKPKGVYSGAFGDVHVSIKEGLLYGVLTYDKDGSLSKKQFFRKYQKLGNIIFPTELVEMINLEDGGELKRLTTYNDLKLNQFSNEAFYNFDVSSLVISDN